MKGGGSLITGPNHPQTPTTHQKKKKKKKKKKTQPHKQRKPKPQKKNTKNPRKKTKKKKKKTPKPKQKETQKQKTPKKHNQKKKKKVDGVLREIDIRHGTVIQETLSPLVRKLSRGHIRGKKGEGEHSRRKSAELINITRLVNSHARRGKTCGGSYIFERLH